MNNKFDVLLDSAGLGDLVETMYVLDKMNHSQYQDKIGIIPDYNTNEERWELFQAPSAWKKVTIDHPAYWQYVRDNKQYKALVAVNASLIPTELITSFTDNNEFKQFNTNVYGVLPSSSAGSDTRIGLNGKTKHIFIHNYVRTGNSTSGYTYHYYFSHYSWDGYKFTRITNNYVTGGDPFGAAVTPWYTFPWNYVVLHDMNDLLVYLDGSTDKKGYTWVSWQEKFGVCMPTNGTSGLLYNIDKKDYQLFTKASVDNTLTRLCTDYSERFALLQQSTTEWCLIDRQLKQSKRITLPTAKILPAGVTRDAVSPDGTMCAHIDTTATNPNLVVVRLSDGEVIYSSPDLSACNTAIWTKDNVIYTNTTTGVVSRYKFSGTPSNPVITPDSYYLAPSAASYSMQYIAEIDKIIMIKTTTANGMPLYHIINAITGDLEKSDIGSNWIALVTNIGCQNYCWKVPGDGPVRLVIPCTVAGQLVFLEYDKATNFWTESVDTTALAPRARTLQWYLPPAYFDNNTIMVYSNGGTAAANGHFEVYDLNTKKKIFASAVDNTAGVIRRIDDTHFGWEGNISSEIYRIDPISRMVTLVVSHPDNVQSIYMGFNN